MTLISTQDCDLKTQVADVQVRVGACTRKVEKGLELLKVSSAAALDPGLPGLLLRIPLTGHLYNCMTLLQRETNYLRYLMLTPDSRRPHFRRSTQDCAVSKPESCERPVTKKPAQPAVFDPPAACMVSDGVRQFDLNQGSEP